MASEYTPSEMMAAVAARELGNGEVVFVGIGLPNLACNLARALQAPDLVLIYESGAVGAVPERLPVSIGFGSSEEAGAKAFIMELVVQADQTYPPIEIRRDVRLGMADLRLDLSYYVRGDDLFLEAGVANHGSDSISLQMTAFAPDLPRTKAQVNDLSAGDRTIKRFAFAGELSRLRGQRIVVTIQNPETSARISRSILIR